MPRATWNGFLRLSLVSCPVYLGYERGHDDPVYLDARCYVDPDLHAF